jgi:hypothetical protein
VVVGCALLCLAWRTPAHATAAYVDAVGACDGNTPCFTTIQAGVNNVSVFPNIVVVYPGTYPESVDLSLMGSAVGGMPDNIQIINADLPFFVPAAAPAVIPSTPQPVHPLLERFGISPADPLLLLRQMLNHPRGLTQPDAAAAPVTLAEVKINPATGPAVFHSVTPFPGRVNLAGLTFKSADDDGVRLHVMGGSITVFRGIADGNGGVGLDLVATPGPISAELDIDVRFVSADGNGEDGIQATAAEDITLVNVGANGNMGNGARLRATMRLEITTVPTDSIPLPVQEFPSTTFNNNKANGLIALASDPLVIGVASFQTEVFFLPIEATGNAAAGMDLQGNDTVAVVQVKGDNNQVGIKATTPGMIFALGSSASENDLQGLDLASAAAPTAESDAAVVVLGVSANRNMSTGMALTTPNAGVLVADSIAIGNKEGVVIDQLGPGTSTLVNGSILCSNTSSGMRLNDNETVNADGNWWGDVSGPFHAGNNPGGLGNPVVDGSSGGGAGTVDFLPFIDTISARALGSVVEFQFSGGGGTVFLGNPFPDGFGALGEIRAAEPPFTLMTDNGVLIGSDETGPTVHEFINQPNGIVRVLLQPAQSGAATVTLAGPCALDSSLTFQVRAVTAPLLSSRVFAMLAVALALAGMTFLRRQSAGAR